MEKSIDIYMIQEHWLFDCQLNILQEIHQDYNGECTQGLQNHTFSNLLDFRLFIC
jgi:hypothetical protein